MRSEIYFALFLNCHFGGATLNTILLESKIMKYHTDLRIVLEALEGRQKEFNWLITDFECNYYPNL